MAARGAAVNRETDEGMKENFTKYGGASYVHIVCYSPQKRESRVLERWKKLIRGVLIRERVKRTYSLT